MRSLAVALLLPFAAVGATQAHSAPTLAAAPTPTCASGLTYTQDYGGAIADKCVKTSPMKCSLQYVVDGSSSVDQCKPLNPGGAVSSYASECATTACRQAGQDRCGSCTSIAPTTCTQPTLVADYGGSNVDRCKLVTNATYPTGCASGSSIVRQAGADACLKLAAPTCTSGTLKTQVGKDGCGATTGPS